MKIKRNRVKKISTMIMSIFMAFSACYTSTPIKAASYTVNFGASTGISYTASGPALDGTNTSDWNANYPILLINGKPVFCLDPSQLVYDGVGGYTDSDFSSDLKKQMNLIALHGYYEHGQSAEWYMASQFMMWELRGWTINTTNLANYAGMKADIQNRINHHYDKPNFVNVPTSITVDQTITLTDTNNVLARFEVNPIEGVTFNKSDNQLSITPSINAPDELSIVLEAYAQGDGTNSSVVYRIPGMPNQVVGKFNYKDPTFHNINLKVDKFGSLKIAKQNNEGTMIPGTTFELSYNVDMSNPIGTYTTGADGNVTIDQLLPQTIYIQEIAVPANLILDPTIRSINIIPNDVVTYTAINNIQKGKINLKKVDKDIGNIPQGDATLQGAIYGLFAKENIVDPITGSTLIGKGVKIAERTTKIDGSMDSIEDLYLGSYYAQELVASNGYEINSEKIDVLLNYAGANETIVIKDITSKEKVIDGDFKITKVIEVDPAHSEITKPEKDAEFVVVLKKYVDRYGSVEEAYKHKDEFADKEYDLLVTDKDGEDISKKLAFGTYMVKQTKVGDENVDMLEKPFEVKIENENQPTIKYVVSNQKFLSYLQLEKKDAETGKTVTLSKTSFKIYDVENDQYLSQRVGLVRHDTWITDDTGKVTLPLKVPAGKYRLEEIKAPAGYLINKDKIDFVMKESNVSIVDDEGEPIQIVEFNNSKPTGSTKLIKSDKDSAETLSGVQYQLTAAKDIVDVADGSIIYNAGDPVSMDISENGYYLTNELGEINVEGLPLGSYTWKETKALDGYVQDTKEYTFELKQKDDVQEVYTQEQELTNQKTKVEILKEDVKNNALVDAHLRLVDEDENIVKEWISKKGSMKLEGLLVGKEYTLYEDEAPEGYVISKPVKFKIKNTTDTQEIKLLDNQISASKTNVDGKLLSGAKMQVVSAKTNDIVDEWTSKDESHYINNLIEGQEYILRELEAPKGYVLAKDITFIANDKKEIQTISMLDKQVTALKIDEDGNVLPGAKMQVVSAKTKEIVDEWTSTEKEHNISNLIEGNSYILRELEAPEGLELADDIEFTVNDKKDTQALEMSDKYIVSEIMVNKVDYYDRTDILKVAEFTIYKDKECLQPIKVEKTDTSNGIATFKKMRYGTYYIKETAAPAGYELSKEVIEVTIDDDWVSGTNKQRTIIFPDKLLPSSGGASTGDNTSLQSNVLLLSVSALMVLYLVRKRKETNK